MYTAEDPACVGPIDHRCQAKPHLIEGTWGCVPCRLRQPSTLDARLQGSDRKMSLSRKRERTHMIEKDHARVGVGAALMDGGTVHGEFVLQKKSCPSCERGGAAKYCMCFSVAELSASNEFQILQRDVPRK